jgi:cytochrome c556
MRLFFTAIAALSLTACNSGESTDGNQALAEANATGNATTAVVENAIQNSAATPLQKEQALALMKERHENYERIGKAMRAAKKGIDTGNLPAVREAAATINQLAPQAATWFPAGTGPDVGKTHARAEIWQQPEQFAQGMKRFRTGAAAFQQAAAAGEMTQIKAAHADLGQACKSCHDRFRHED